MRLVGSGCLIAFFIGLNACGRVSAGHYTEGEGGAEGAPFAPPVGPAGDAGQGSALGEGGEAAAATGGVSAAPQGGHAPVGGGSSIGGDATALDCEPGQVVCVQNQVGSCTGDGRALGQITKDCQAAGQVCDLQGGCAASVSDEIGLGPGLRSVGARAGMTYVEVIDVEMRRVISQLEAHLVVEQRAELGWFIYEGDGDTYRLRAQAWTEPEAAGDAYYASGPMSYELEPGKRYALGVYVPAPHVEIFMNGAPTPKTRLLSFGHVLGGSVVGGIDYLEPREFPPIADYLQLRITSALP